MRHSLDSHPLVGWEWGNEGESLWPAKAGHWIIRGADREKFGFWAYIILYIKRRLSHLCMGFSNSYFMIIYRHERYKEQTKHIQT
jgi:hypothetical protein